jgi:hypothetical protein
MLSPPDPEGNKSIHFCDLEAEVTDLQRGIDVIKETMRDLSAPQGTTLQYEVDDDFVEISVYEE